METPEGVRYQVDGGEIFKSPSSAAKHVTGGAVNGWVFWSVEGTEKPKREPKAKAARKQSPAAKKPTKASKKSKAKKGKAMRAASKGVASYGCGACGETFPTMKAATQHAMTHTAG